jgi:hypothetical protein
MEKLSIKKAATVFLPLGMLLAACGDTGPEVTKGVPAKVVQHAYDDRDVWTTIISTGKTVIPVTHVDPEHFYLTVEQCGHEEFMDDNSDGCGIFQVEVSQETYSQFADGSTIVFSK